MKEVVLKVSEALSQDVGSGRARLDGKTRLELDVTPGDIIEIEGSQKTSAVVWRSRPMDEGKGIIRIDNLTRKNAGVGMGDKVIVRKIVPKVAKKVIMAPAISQGQRIQFGQGIEHLVKRGLLHTWHRIIRKFASIRRHKDRAQGNRYDWRGNRSHC